MSTGLFDLSGKVALVTGATHGLGMAMAMGLGEAGATVVVNEHSSDEKIVGSDRTSTRPGASPPMVTVSMSPMKRRWKPLVAKIEQEVGPDRYPGEQRRHHQTCAVAGYAS